jgi:hypothetical protein
MSDLYIKKENESHESTSWWEGIGIEILVKWDNNWIIAVKERDKNMDRLYKYIFTCFFLGFFTYLSWCRVQLLTLLFVFFDMYKTSFHVELRTRCAKANP